MKTITLKADLVYAGDLIVVNEKYPFHEGIVERRLLPANAENNAVLLEQHVVEAFSKLMDKLDAWSQITAISGWRSLQEQTALYEKALADHGEGFTKQYVALPGHSEHQTGLAVDLALVQEKIDPIRPAFPYWGICQCFRKDAVQYGFIERYPQFKTHQTGIAHEPWHFRYVGVPHAEIIREYGFALEEYIAFLKRYPFEKEKFIYTTRDTKNSVRISYLPAERAADTRFEIDDSIHYSVSGNNVDGFIITEWRHQHGEQ